MRKNVQKTKKNQENAKEKLYGYMIHALWLYDIRKNGKNKHWRKHFFPLINNHFPAGNKLL